MDFMEEYGKIVDVLLRICETGYGFGFIKRHLSGKICKRFSVYEKA